MAKINENRAAKESPVEAAIKQGTSTPTSETRFSHRNYNVTCKKTGITIHVKGCRNVAAAIVDVRGKKKKLKNGHTVVLTGPFTVVEQC